MHRYLTPADILPNEAYRVLRAQKRSELSALKQDRRVAIGPYAMLYFENFATMQHQVQEMLLIEGGGDEQLHDELKVYNPLIPQGNALCATLMFEIEDPGRRSRLLNQWSGIETTLTLTLGSEVSPGIPLYNEHEVDDVTAAGKTSSVHFLRFDVSPQAITLWRTTMDPVILSITHPYYTHSCGLTSATRAALMKDFA